MTAQAFDDLTAIPLERFAAFPLATALIPAGSTLATWEMRARTRADLGRQDTARNADLGLTAAAIRGEVGKPFWQG